MHGKDYNRDEVKEIISSVIEKTGESQLKSIVYMRTELQKLAETIDKLHEDVLMTRSHQVRGKQIPKATDELDAVVDATEEASASIMDACDVIQEIIVPLSDEGLKDKIQEQVSKIFESCSFQDITGQRIRKVVKALHDIENSVDALLSVFGEVAEEDMPEEVDTRTEDEKLMEGPQLAGKGIDQDEIDKLLAAFD